MGTGEPVSNIADLKKKAASSSDGEAYLSINRSNSHRTGLVARKGQLVVEIIIQLFPNGQVDLDDLSRMVSALCSLSDRGYVLSCDDGSITCERCTVEEMIDEEVRETSRILKK
jgi:hypothetical protein